MKCLNKDNGAFDHTIETVRKCLTEFSGELVGAEFGIAYGGGVEEIGKVWKGRGTVHGFDTFAGHPDQTSYSLKSHEARCMDLQYHFNGRSGLSYEEQRAELDRQDLSNVVLHKGLINDESLKGIDRLHYVLLDMDIVSAMILGFTLVDPLIVPGGFLCLHDVIPRGHIFGLFGLYKEIMATDRYELIGEYQSSYLVILRRKK